MYHLWVVTKVDGVVLVVNQGVLRGAEPASGAAKSPAWPRDLASASIVLAVSRGAARRGEPGLSASGGPDERRDGGDDLPGFGGGAPLLR